jgi:hypothetical protein
MQVRLALDVMAPDETVRFLVLEEKRDKEVVPGFKVEMICGPEGEALLEATLPVFRWDHEIYSQRVVQLPAPNIETSDPAKGFDIVREAACTWMMSYVGWVLSLRAQQ